MEAEKSSAIQQDAFDAEKFQGEVLLWTRHNFPESEAWMPLIGLCEEMGEFHEAWLDAEKSLEACEMEEEDAIGDMVIFLAHYCAVNGYHMLQCFDRQRKVWEKMFFPMAELSGHLASAVGKLCHAHLKLQHKIRVNQNHREAAQKAIGDIIGVLHLHCEYKLKDFTGIVERTWRHVQSRDWKKNKIDGRVSEESKKTVWAFKSGKEVPF